MKARILALCGILVMVAILALALAWINGDTQPTRWIETPVAPASAPAQVGQ